MKIYYNIDIDRRKFEGRTQLATKIMSFLKTQGFQFTSNPADADLLHFHSSGIAESYQAYQLKKKYKIPCIYSLYSNAKTSPIMHLVNFFIQKIYFQKTATRFLPSYSAALPLKWRSIFLKKLDLVVVPSRYLQRNLPGNSIVIPFGIDVHKFKPLKKKKINPQIIKVAYFGHPGVFKGLNDFVNASKQFSKFIELHVFMTQRFPKVDSYIRTRNPFIEIHGFTDNIVEAYNSMDIIILPYRTEIGTIANPLVLLEAMSCGKAIVTTNFLFIKEIVKDAAEIVEKYSPKSIAKAVNELTLNPARREYLGRKSREIILENYSLDKMLQGYLSLYKKLEFNHYEKK